MPIEVGLWTSRKEAEPALRSAFERATDRVLKYLRVEDAA